MTKLRGLGIGGQSSVQMDHRENRQELRHLTSITQHPLRGGKGYSPICTGERFTNPPRITHSKRSLTCHSASLTKDGFFPPLSFPTGSCWGLRARATQSCHLGCHHVSLIESWWVPPGSGQWLRVQDHVPTEGQHAMTAHVNSECPGSKPPCQEAGPFLGCSQKIISEAQEPPHPAQAPVVGQPGPARA